MGKNAIVSNPCPLCYNMLFCYSSAFVLVSSHDKHCLVLVLVHIGEGSMALYEHAHVQRDLELLAQLLHPFRLMLPAAIGEEDEGYTLCLEIGQCFVCARKRIGAAN